nr:hypothetical protein Iba_chr15aCG6870 [Ipomoea batatas]
MREGNCVISLYPSLNDVVLRFPFPSRSFAQALPASTNGSSEQLVTRTRQPLYIVKMFRSAVDAQVPELMIITGTLRQTQTIHLVNRQHYLPSSSVRQKEEQLETEEGDAATVRRRGVHAAATVDLLNLPEIPTPSLLPCIVETRGGKLLRSCLDHRKRSFALPPECSASPGKGKTGDAIVGAAVVAPFVAKLRRRRNNPPPSPIVAVEPLGEREK